MKKKMIYLILPAVALIVFVQAFAQIAMAACTVSAEDPVYDSTTVNVGTTRSVSATFRCSADSDTATISFVPDSSSLTAVTDSGASQYESVSITTSGVTKTFYMSASAAGSYGFYIKATNAQGGGAQTTTNYIQYVDPESLTMSLTDDPTGTYDAGDAVGIAVSITNQLASTQTRNLTLWFSSGGSSFTVSGDTQTQTLSLAGSTTQQIIWNVTLTGLSGTQYAYIRLGDSTQAATITFTETPATTTSTTTTTQRAAAGGTSGTTTTTTAGETTTTTLPPVEETEIVESVAAGETATFEFEEASTLKIESVAIVAGSALSTIAVTAKESSLPSGAAAPISSDVGVVYKYIELTKTAFTDEDIITATIKFKVDKPWLIANSVDENKVYLYRYADGAWEKLTTSKLSSDANYVYYEAESTGLSVFAVGGEKLPSAITTTTTPAKVTLPLGEIAVWQIIIIALIIVAILILVLYKKGILVF